MGTPYLSEIRMVGFNFPPKGWAFCNGQTLAINQNAALFSLMGTFYGGNGTTTFLLPNLQARIPMHFGQGLGLTPRNIGDVGGEQAVTLTVAQLPAHGHTVQGVNAAGANAAPTVQSFANSSGTRAYVAGPANTLLNPNVVGNGGGGQPHNNLAPYLVINFVIALVGIFPSRN